MPEGPDKLSVWKSCSRLLAPGLSATRPGTATTVNEQNTDSESINLFLSNQYNKKSKKAQSKTQM